MGDIKDETKKTKINSNVDKAISISKKRKNGDISIEKTAGHKKDFKCPKSSCNGILTQYISVAAFKPWRYHCTSCAAEFEYH